MIYPTLLLRFFVSLLENPFCSQLIAFFVFCRLGVLPFFIAANKSYHSWLVAQSSLLATLG
jgi:hypothetical protein